MDMAEEDLVNLPKRLDSLMHQINKVIFTNVSRGIFNAHKLIYSFLIATSIERKEGLLDSQLWGVYLRGAGIMDFTL